MLEKKERKEMMNEIEILETLANCKTRRELESLWTKTYLTYRQDAFKLQKHFEERRSEVVNTAQQFSEAYRANGWD
jgi:hypothetical protein